MFDIIRQNRGWFMFEGILFVLLGLIGIFLPVYFTIAVELFVGWLFIFSGIATAYRAFVTRGSSSFLVSLLSAILFLAVGAMLLAYPIGGVISLTLLLTIYFIAQGIAQIILGFQFKDHPRWGWVVISGIISLIMAGIIISGWPTTALWVIGLLVGINLLFFGISLLGLCYQVGSEK